MERRILGRTGIHVSVIGMGCEGFEGKSGVDCEKLLDFAMEKGIYFFDMYTSNPKLRQNVGNALSKYSRDCFAIQGHLGSASVSYTHLDVYKRQVTTHWIIGRYCTCPHPRRG